jgi:hypothetical protein
MRGRRLHGAITSQLADWMFKQVGTKVQVLKTRELRISRLRLAAGGRACYVAVSGLPYQPAAGSGPGSLQDDQA